LRDSVRHYAGGGGRSRFGALHPTEPIAETFLNLDKSYPNQIFTAVIFGSDRPKFSTPETTLQGKRVCVTGTIQLYRGAPEIILRDPTQISE
jgi:hypothetical protein